MSLVNRGGLNEGDEEGEEREGVEKSIQQLREMEPWNKEPWS